MTTPVERTRALVQTREFLLELCDSIKTPGLPDQVRSEARALLRHYPDAGLLEFAAMAFPNVWASPSGRKNSAPPYRELLAMMRRDRMPAVEASNDVRGDKTNESSSESAARPPSQSGSTE